MKRRLYQSLSGVALIALTSIMCTFTSSQPLPDPTEMAANVEKTIVAAKGTMEAEFNQAMKITAESAQSSEATQGSKSLGTGAIRGDLSYPSEMIPPMRIVAFSSDDSWYYVDVQNASSYEIAGLPAGTYTVVAYPLGTEASNFSGGYSQAVLCGLNADCIDHTLVKVQVDSGSTLEGINPGDWYAPEGSFPLDPTQR